MLVPPLKSFLNNFQIRESHAGYYAGLGKSLVRALQGWSTPQGLKQNIIQKKEQKYRHSSERTEKQTLFKRRNRKIDILQKKEQKHRHYSVGRTERQTFFRKKKRKANIVKKEEQKDRHY